MKRLEEYHVDRLPEKRIIIVKEIEIILFKIKIQGYQSPTLRCR